MQPCIMSLFGHERSGGKGILTSKQRVSISKYYTACKEGKMVERKIPYMSKLSKHNLHHKMVILFFESVSQKVTRTHYN